MTIKSQVGQSHGGMFGVVQRALARATSHIWFERGEIRDRALVAQRCDIVIQKIRVNFWALFPWSSGHYSTPRQCHRPSQIFTAPGRLFECLSWCHFLTVLFPPKQTYEKWHHFFATRKIRSVPMTIRDVSWHCRSVGPEPGAQK